jgi:starch-binding outer membrane protein, SusD/RagB family
MQTYIKRFLGGAVLALSVSACNNFLTGEGISTDPNNPTQATTNQLFVAAEAALFALQQGPVAQFSCLVVQHCGGVGNYVEAYGFDYGIDSDSFNADMLQVYVGGGILDLHTIEKRSEDAGDRVYAGMAKVIEAMQVSFAADNWGDVPYSESVSDNLTPKFDNQMDIYASLQTLLDAAIADLGSGAGTGPVPGDVDLIYGGDAAKWVRAAYTLKARLHMHTAEVLGAPAYTAAIAAATLGINNVNEDFSSSHTSATSERNLWFQFATSTFGQYLKAGSALIAVMQNRSAGGPDVQRLAEYFSDVDPATAGKQYAGVDVNSATQPNVVSEVATLTGETRITDVFRQPMLSWDENQLIRAEANAALGNTGAAQPFLDAERAAHGLASIPATLQNIAEEEYVEYFQNIEAWQSYKRTCWPNLRPATGKLRIPARVLYGSTEANTNTNTPSSADQTNRGGAAIDEPDAFPGRNRNDPPGGTVLNDAACLGQ